jgi:hypothetical protein
MIADEIEAAHLAISGITLEVLRARRRSPRRESEDDASTGQQCEKKSPHHRRWRRGSLDVDIPASYESTPLTYSCPPHSFGSAHTRPPMQYAPGITMLMRGHVRLTLCGAAG